MNELSRKKVEKIIEQMKDGVSRPECWTCDCFQGFLVQLEIDCPEDVSDMTRRLKVPTAKMHGCLGCDPCPAGELFTNYLRDKMDDISYSCQKGVDNMKRDTEEEKIKKSVRQGYAEIAKTGSGCCGPRNSCCGGINAAKNISKKIGYTEGDMQNVPEGANLGLGCGNPIALASLKQGETVLDLGSGAGFDCFLAANKVGPAGKVIGVDMTAEMVEKANENARKGHYTNIEFRVGEIESLPVDDNSVDVIISNCVINLVPDKARAFKQAYRVLRPSGRLMVSDVVLIKELPESIRTSVEAYIGCLSGAMMKNDYLKAIAAAGFKNIQVLDETPFPLDVMANDPTAQAILAAPQVSPEDLKSAENSVVSIKVSATKNAF